jgi:hypothetical protein
MLFSNKKWVVTQAVPGAPEKVLDHLAAKLREEMTSLGAGYADAVSVDTERRTVTVTGHWWYQGTYAIESDPHGTLVTYRVRNVATRARLLAFLDKPSYAQRMRRELASRLRALP